VARRRPPPFELELALHGTFGLELALLGTFELELAPLGTFELGLAGPRAARNRGLAGSERGTRGV
jgi:hypothetical protein